VTDLAALKAANALRWSRAKFTRSFASVAKHLVDPIAKERYQAVSKQTGVPWPFIAVVHERESSQDWTASLAQGDPWNQVSKHVPAGRGPFKSWEEAAVDALVSCAPHAAKNTDWSIGGTLTMLEQYNGLGYASRGRASPYIWSGTDQYVSGKYVRDGVYDANAVDQQLGCAGLLMAMMALDPTITFTGAKITPNITMTTISTKPVQPSITNPAKGSIGAWIASIFSAIFKRK
jgi:lysozyme family protein